ncbi:MAG: glycosyltransferase [Lachnospiraceae bacterium]|nr:glycosyltransferase [Lachnospiraceae bacterium]
MRNLLYSVEKMVAFPVVEVWDRVTPMRVISKIAEWHKLEKIHPYGNPECIRKEREWNENDKIQLSLICPLYNSEIYLETLLPCLLKQETEYGYEIIFVDDGSKDSAFAVIKSYCEKYPEKISIIKQENMGIAEARNTGINYAKGKYIGFIDHDDMIKKNYVQKLLETAIAEDADIVKCAIEEIEEGRVVASSSKEYMNISGAMKDELLTSIGYVWGGVYKRELFNRVSFPRGYWYEDMIGRSLLKRQSKKYIQLSDVLYIKVRSENNASRKIWSSKEYKCLEQLYLVKEIISANEELKLGKDVYFYKALLKECSKTLAGRIQGLRVGDRKIVLYCVSDLMKELWKEEYDIILNKKERLWNKAMLRNNFLIWTFLNMVY